MVAEEKDDRRYDRRRDYKSESKSDRRPSYHAAIYESDGESMARKLRKLLREDAKAERGDGIRKARETALLSPRFAASRAEKEKQLAVALNEKNRISQLLSKKDTLARDLSASLKTHEEEQARRIAALETDVADLTSKLAEAEKRGPATRSKQSGTSRRNASTATHHCASTQTDPEEPPEPGPESAPG